jgi:hypothetical protein
MLKLALAAKNLPRDRVRFVSMPLADVDYQAPGIGSTVLWDPAGSARLFDALRADRPVETVAASAAGAPVTMPSGAPPQPAATPEAATKKPAKKAHVAQATPLAVRAADSDICR